MDLHASVFHHRRSVVHGSIDAAELLEDQNRAPDEQAATVVRAQGSQALALRQLARLLELVDLGLKRSEGPVEVLWLVQLAHHFGHLF